jgi:redox-sensitive bicupin YhaK (pirin superfamily)
MDRKEFVKRSLLGAGVVAAGIPVISAAQDEQKEVGFNHIPATKGETMKNVIIHRADTRGHANHGWLNSYHTFSFAQYYNPERMHFGVLRVLNDDHVAPGMGFGSHPHDNMEIISIPLSGDLEHKDSMGNVAVIRQNDVQVMSAGTGIRHSEYNKNADQQVKFLQIWLFPNKRNVAPRYDQLTFKPEDRNNTWQQILSPNADDAVVWIHQDAWFHWGEWSTGKTAEYKINKSGNGVYVFVISGSVTIGEVKLNARDGMGIVDVSSFEVKADADAFVLLMEVPMN